MTPDTERRPSEFQQPDVPPWAYEPDEPFAVLSAYNSGPTSCRRYDTIEHALDGFVRFHMGPMPGRGACVVDSNMQVVLGYNSVNEHQILWHGCQWGFQQFAKRFDAASVAIWEVMARGEVDPNELPKDIVP